MEGLTGGKVGEAIIVSCIRRLASSVRHEPSKVGIAQFSFLNHESYESYEGMSNRVQDYTYQP